MCRITMTMGVGQSRKLMWYCWKYHIDQNLMDFGPSMVHITFFYHWLEPFRKYLASICQPWPELAQHWPGTAIFVRILPSVILRLILSDYIWKYLPVGTDGKVQRKNWVHWFQSKFSTNSYTLYTCVSLLLQLSNVSEGDTELGISCHFPSGPEMREYMCDGWKPLPHPVTKWHRANALPFW